jgi:3-oxoacyl-[acyl-carrier-protein] synthase III
MLLAETERAGMLERGKIISMTSFGSGFTWASAVVRW